MKNKLPLDHKVRSPRRRFITPAHILASLVGTRVREEFFVDLSLLSIHKYDHNKRNLKKS